MKADNIYTKASCMLIKYDHCKKNTSNSEMATDSSTPPTCHYYKQTD